MDPKKLSQQLWLQYLASLRKAITLQGATQIVNPYVVWDWGGKDAGAGLPVAQYLTLDQVPQDPVSDARSYGAKPGFGENYLAFLQQIDQTPGSDDPQYSKLLQDVTDTNAALTAAQGRALAAFSNFRNSSNTSESYSDFLKNEGAGYAGTISEAQGGASLAQTHLAAYLTSRSGPVADAITRYHKNLTAVSDSNNPLVTNQVPGWTTAISPYQYALQITGSKFGSDASKGAARSFSINSDTETYNYSKDWAEGGAFGAFDFFLGEAEGSYSKVQTESFSSSYSITFEFQDLTSINLAPGAWYDPALPGNFKNGPFFSGHSGFRSGDDTFYFGPGGLLSRQITSLVVGYRPRITLDAGQRFASEVQTQWEAEGGLVLGPFAFEAAGGGERKSDTLKIAGSKITARSRGDWPYIVAVVSGWVVDPE